MAAPLPPHVHFESEPPSLSAQVAILGGKTIRHHFTERGYNPGSAENRWHGNFAAHRLMTYRSQEVSRHISISTLTLCGVDRRGNVIWRCPLKLPELKGDGFAMQEDGRLVWLNGHLHLAFSNVRLNGQVVKFKQALVPLNPSGGRDVHVSCGRPIMLPYGHNLDSDPRHEKNWQFFEEDRTTKAVYSICPHVVIDVKTGKHHVTQSDAAKDWSKGWGEMHGGTPPIRIGDSYLSFFNSFVGHREHQRRYVIGAYMFSDAHGKHKITHISKAPLLYGSHEEGFLWESPAHWEPIVAFASGAVVDYHNDCIELSYGINDCFAETAHIPYSAIMEQMMQV